MAKTSTVEAVVKQILVNYMTGKANYVVGHLIRASRSLEECATGMKVNAQLPDLQSIINESPTRYDANPEAVNKTRERIEGLQIAIDLVREQYLKDLFAGHGLTYENPDKYSIDNENDRVKMSFEKVVTRVDDHDYEDYNLVVDAYDKYIEAKKFLYDVCYEETEDDKELNTAPEQVFSKFMFPLTAFFIASLRKGNPADTIDTIEIMFKYKKIPDFLKGIEDCIAKNKDDSMTTELAILQGLMSDGAFCSRIRKVIRDLKTEIIQEKSPKMGEILKGLSELMESEHPHFQEDKEGTDSDPDFDLS